MLDYVVEKHGCMWTNGIHKWSPYLPAAAAPIRCETGFAPGTVNGELFAFVDESLRPHSRPIHDYTQQATYSGYKRVHGVKFQGVVLPNG
ncbi:unnamed protein product [Discosporangium mesarthrocarpum]